MKSFLFLLYIVLLILLMQTPQNLILKIVLVDVALLVLQKKVLKINYNFTKIPILVSMLITVFI